MTLDQFKRSLSRRTAPRHLAPALAALWWAGKGDWERAHRLVMDAEGGDAARVHAYLHRVEGDLDNARYWYRRAKCAPASGPLAEEWDAIAGALLAASSGQRSARPSGARSDGRTTARPARA